MSTIIVSTMHMADITRVCEQWTGLGILEVDRLQVPDNLMFL